MKERVLYIVISADDLRSITSIYYDLVLTSILSGIPSSLYELQAKILVPVFLLGECGEYEPIKQSDITKSLAGYCKANKRTKHMGDKRMVPGLLTELERMGFIKKILNEDDE
ncbi:MAG: hypothetical protein QXV17_07650 [Candidatus Micrarchaeaceae archaeon]